MKTQIFVIIILIFFIPLISIAQHAGYTLYTLPL